MSYTLNIEPNIVTDAENYAVRNGTTLDAVIRACLLVFVAHGAIDHGTDPSSLKGSMPKSRVLKIGSMKDEILLPDNFDEAFESLDEESAALFNGTGA